jgi:hypothetical protein
MGGELARVARNGINGNHDLKVLRLENISLSEFVRRLCV